MFCIFVLLAEEDEAPLSQTDSFFVSGCVFPFSHIVLVLEVSGSNKVTYLRKNGGNHHNERLAFSEHICVNN